MAGWSPRFIQIAAEGGNWVQMPDVHGLTSLPDTYPSLTSQASRRVDLSAAEGPILSCMEGVVDRVARAALERVNAWLVVARRSAGTLGRQKIKEAALVLQQQAK